jgi:hypothetical protein
MAINNDLKGMEEFIFKIFPFSFQASQDYVKKSSTESANIKMPFCHRGQKGMDL